MKRTRLMLEQLESREVPAVIFAEGFEGAFPGNNWSVNTSQSRKWDDVSSKAHTGNWSGFGSYRSATDRSYVNNMATSMERTVNLAGYTSPVLSFHDWLNTEANYDFLRVKVNGTEIWHDSGSKPVWNAQSLSLAAYAGQSRVTVRFEFTSDGSIVPSGNAGVWLDDITLTASPAGQQQQQITSRSFPLSDSREAQIRSEFTGFGRGVDLLNGLVASSEYQGANDAARLEGLNKFRGAPNPARVLWVRGDLLRRTVGETPQVLSLLRPDSGSLRVSANGRTTSYTITNGNLYASGNPNPVGTIENDALYRLNGVSRVSYTELSTELQLIEGGNTVLQFHNAHPENYASYVAPQMQQRITSLIIEARREGMNPRVAAGTGYRSPAAQHQLYLGGRVTEADAWQSNHQYGVAVDVTLMSSDGQRGLAASNADWSRLGVIGEGFGLEWGGRWAQFQDRPHFQWPRLSWQELKRAYARGAGVTTNQLTANISTPKLTGLQEVWRTVGAA